ncbi:hypothetical protein [Bradyrhizobium sp. Tv2a-2]|uniref:hypothetical protein n=1 Tax=Bradyrhizobium sp. Tv2a-2 TaxID=113395 RepID=UPI0004667720|nr:hypothetical protein [Bradyrhizobium sp. Tv2a-2]
MPHKQAAALSPEIQKRIAQIETMNLEEVSASLFGILDEFRSGTTPPYQADAIRNAAYNRIQAIRKELIG